MKSKREIFKIAFKSVSRESGISQIVTGGNVFQILGLDTEKKQTFLSVMLTIPQDARPHLDEKVKAKDFKAGSDPKAKAKTKAEAKCHWLER